MTEDLSINQPPTLPASLLRTQDWDAHYLREQQSAIGEIRSKFFATLGIELTTPRIQQDELSDVDEQDLKDLLDDTVSESDSMEALVECQKEEETKTGCQVFASNKTSIKDLFSDRSNQESANLFEMYSLEKFDCLGDLLDSSRDRLRVNYFRRQIESQQIQIGEELKEEEFSCKKRCFQYASDLLEYAIDNHPKKILKLQ